MHVALKSMAAIEHERLTFRIRVDPRAFLEPTPWFPDREAFVLEMTEELSDPPGRRAAVVVSESEPAVVAGAMTLEFLSAASYRKRPTDTRSARPSVTTSRPA
ncbi:hypothetical protein ACGFIF_44245 [Kribbella sp. NPDC049174]|uniref:hypothetical protein n=1 Tax=Kribbella sp. NPDC049174 TaxID=3364112 RepID=UPI003717919F